MQPSQTFLIRPLFDPESSTWSYILTDRDSEKALIIDPVLEQAERDYKLLKEMGVKLAYVVETHIHADHVTAASKLREMTGAKIVYGAANKVEGADIFLSEGDEVRIGNTAIKALATPGHTAGCVSYAMPGAVFTGDALMIRACGRTDFQSGSAPTLYKSVYQKLFPMPDDTLVFPAHDYKGMVFSTIGEEKRHNPRLKNGIAESQFAEVMNNLNLSHPKKIDIAVPANMRAGRLTAIA